MPPAASMLEEHLPVIEEAIRFACRHAGFPPQDAEEFEGWAKLRLVERQEAVFAGYRGRGTLAAYLAVIVQNLFRDYRTHLWGRWRPSAEAQRLGPEAIELETLTSRDGLDFETAIEMMVSRNPALRSRDELEALAGQLPRRERRSFVSEEALYYVGTQDGVESRVEDTENARVQADVEEAFAAVLSGLDPQDVLLMKMSFRDGFSVATIARALAIQPRVLYYRREVCLKQLRQELENRGLTWDHVKKILGWDGLSLALVAADDETEPPEGRS